MSEWVNARLQIEKQHRQVLVATQCFANQIGQLNITDTEINQDEFVDKAIELSLKAAGKFINVLVDKRWINYE